MNAELNKKVFEFLNGRVHEVDFKILFPELPPLGESHTVNVVTIATLYELVNWLMKDKSL